MKVYIYGLYKENFEYTSNKIDEGLFYVGITKNIKTRINGHKSKTNNLLKKAYIKKYGIIFKILYECECYEEAIEKEAFLIRWFGRLIDNTGILTNILIESKDICNFNLGKSFSTQHKAKISESSLNRSELYWAEQRNKRLSLPIEQIHKILQEWQDSFPIDKSICKKYKIKPNVFNWWIRKYRPDLRNLLNENRKKHIQKMIELNLKQSEYSSMIGICPSAISKWYCSFIRDNKQIKPKQCVKNLEYKKQKYAEWINSGLSKREFCKNNNINYASFKAWKKYYEEY
jgi:predicted GIY-YIG superfamily endonuclease/predicted transcriptional regulator